MWPKAIVFDASGTILDDLYVVWRANSEAYESLGLRGIETLEEFRRKFRLPVPTFHEENGVPPELIRAVDQKFREFYPRYSAQVRILPEVEVVLEELGRRGILLGVASNIPTSFLKEHLRNFGIENHFGAIVGQEDCEEQKPSPRPILTALRKLGVKPPDALYVGDMEEDILAGRRARVKTCAIAREESYHPRWKLERQNPDYLISNLRELLDICSTA